MNRPTALRLIAIALVFYGVWRALYVPPMLVGPPMPVVLLCVVLEAVFGIVAGIGVWRGASWAPLAVVLLGAIIAVTALIEGFVLGIIPYLFALLETVGAIVLALLLAAYVAGRLGATP